MALPLNNDSHVAKWRSPAINKEHFSGLGMTRTFALMGAVGMATTAFSSGNQFLEDAWNDDPNKFQRAGFAAGGMVGEATMLGSTAYMGWDLWRRNGAQQMAKGPGKNGPLYNVLNNGNFSRDMGGGFNQIINKEEVSKMKGLRYGQKATSFRAGLGKGFVGNFGMRMNFGAMLLTPIAAGMAASATFGLAGKVLDAVHSESKRNQNLTYDKRYFNTQQYDMSSYQQLGAAMQQQESRMLSVARIYHG